MLISSSFSYNFGLSLGGKSSLANSKVLKGRYHFILVLLLTFLLSQTPEAMRKFGLHFPFCWVLMDKIFIGVVVEISG